MKGFLFFFFFLVEGICSIEAQQLVNKQKVTNAVFNTLVNAYGSAKSAPDILLLSNSNPERVLARYFPYPSPIIKIDERIFDICMSLKGDSLNALAIIISHELAHYYADHAWCSDYAFAFQNSSFGKALQKVSKEAKMEKEAYADHFGLFYACIAGYQSFGVFPSLISQVYKKYALLDITPGYPSKIERIKIGMVAESSIKNYYPLFKSGLQALRDKSYDSALYKFNQLLRVFPSREMYNNAGSSCLLMALQLKPLQRKEFIYPIEIDASSRLNIESQRSVAEDKIEKMRELLAQAKKHFEKALSLDANYIEAKLNLASLYDISGNSDAALGVLKDLTTTDPVVQEKILMLKCIAYYHNEDDRKMHATLDEWRVNYSVEKNYNYILLSSN